MYYTVRHVCITYTCCTIEIYLCILFPIAVTISFNEDSFTVSEGDGTLDSLISVILTGESEIELSIPLQLLSGTAQQGIKTYFSSQVAHEVKNDLIFVPCA